MKLDQWLEEATGSFPSGVCERFAQEYAAHLEDSVAAGGSGDVLEVFGDPKALKRKLKRLYVSQERLDQISNLGKLVWVFRVIQFFLLGLTLRSVIRFFDTPQFVHFLVNFVLIAAPALLIWGYSYRWEQTRRASFQVGAYSLATGVSSIYGLTFDSADRADVMTGLSVGVIIIGGFIYTLIEDRRIDRTLRIESQTRLGSRSEG